MIDINTQSLRAMTLAIERTTGARDSSSDVFVEEILVALSVVETFDDRANLGARHRSHDAMSRRDPRLSRHMPGKKRSVRNLLIINWLRMLRSNTIRMRLRREPA
jgi:hypothetical protein